MFYTNPKTIVDIEVAHQNTLLRYAHRSIEFGLENQSLMPVAKASFDSVLQQTGASFVTLLKGGELRGCIGTVEPYQALISDVIQHAYDAAFNDRRFPPLVKEEYEGLMLELSILSPKKRIPSESERELLENLIPFTHGLIIVDGYRKATFLPSVWEKLGNKEMFLQNLKLKAGIPADYWSPAIQAFTYEVIKIK